MQLSAVFACVRLIAETIAGLPLRFYERSSDGSRVRNEKHPLYRLLSYKPNRYQTRVEFFETIVMQLALHGNAYIHITRNGGVIISLLPLMSVQMAVKLDLQGNVTYEYNDGRNLMVYAQESIWHIKLMGNGLIGMSPLDYARNSIGVAISAEDRVSKMSNNGFKPSGVLMIDKVLKPEQRAAVRASFADLAEGGDDALKVLEAGMTYQQVSMNPKDVQLLETRRFQLEDIARFFGVPSVLINDTSTSTVWGSGVAQIVQGFYKLGLRPYLERIESSLEIWLLPIIERGVTEVEFDFTALLRGDTAARYEAYAKATLNGLKTINECRLEEGDPPVPGGEVARTQQQMIPLTASNSSIPEG
jgi:HK97 family phage portal protein